MPELFLKAPPNPIGPGLPLEEPSKLSLKKSGGEHLHRSGLEGERDVEI